MPARKLAPHVEACLAAVQPRVAPPPLAPRPAAHVQAALAATGAKGAPRAAVQPRTLPRPPGPPAVAVRPGIAPPPRREPLPRRSPVVQPMHFDEGLGFQHLKEPTGYGSVKLKASINGIDIGSAWSQKAKYDEGSEHAEDNVIEYVQSLFLASELNLKVSELDRSVIQSIYDNKKVEVVITNLTASPCSSKRGTTKEKEGCAEKLIELLNDYKKANLSIAITADHYYQPKNVEDAKAKSKKACKDLRNAGIKVTITNP